MCVRDEWTQQDVHRRISQALETLHAKDQYLLDHDVHERTIAQRLAIYLEHEFAGWHVDCEYNRNLGDVKRISALLQNCAQKYPSSEQPSTSGQVQVYPDIIVHCRGTNNQNLLVIELKKAPHCTACDKIKLRHYQKELHYRFALSLSVAVSAAHADKWVWVGSSTPAVRGRRERIEEPPENF